MSTMMAVLDTIHTLSRIKYDGNVDQFLFLYPSAVPNRASVYYFIISDDRGLFSSDRVFAFLDDLPFQSENHIGSLFKISDVLFLEK